MNWLWLNVPLMAVFFLAVAGIPLWLVLRRPDFWVAPADRCRAAHLAARCAAARPGGPTGGHPAVVCLRLSWPATCQPRRCPDMKTSATVARSELVTDAREPIMKVPLTIGDYLSRGAAVYGERTAVFDEPGTAGSLGSLTYRELESRARGMALALDAMGVGHGERVAIVSPNAARFLISYFGVSAYGRILVPVNYRLNADEIGYIIDHSGSIGPAGRPRLRGEPARHQRQAQDRAGRNSRCRALRAGRR